jgi:hypothetical protein
MKKIIFILVITCFDLQTFAQTYSLYEKYVRCVSYTDFESGVSYPLFQLSNNKYVFAENIQTSPWVNDVKIKTTDNNFNNLTDVKIIGGSGNDIGQIFYRTQRKNRHLFWGLSTSIDGTCSYAASHPFQNSYVWLQLFDDSFNVIASCTDIIDSTVDTYFLLNNWPQIVQSKNMDYYYVGIVDSGAQIFKHPKINNETLDPFILAFDSTLKFKWKYFFTGDSSDVFKKAEYGVASIGFDKVAVVLSTNSTNNELLGNQAKGGKDLFVAILDSAGNLIKSKRFGGSKDEFFPTIQYDEQSNRLLIASSSFSKDGDVLVSTGANTTTSNAWILVLDTAANIIHSKGYGTANNKSTPLEPLAYGTNIANSELIDHELWIFGTTSGGGGDFAPDTDSLNRNTFIMVVDVDANLQGIKEIGGKLDDYAQEMLPSFINNDNDMLVYGKTGSNNFPNDTINDFGGCNTGGDDEYFFAILAKAPLQIKEPRTKKNGITLYPNPTNYKVSIDIEHKENYKNISASLYSFDGRILGQQDVFTNQTFDLGNYSSGVYFIHCKLDDDIIIQKVMKY